MRRLFCTLFLSLLLIVGVSIFCTGCAGRFVVAGPAYTGYINMPNYITYEYPYYYHHYSFPREYVRKQYHPYYPRTYRYDSRRDGADRRIGR